MKIHKVGETKQTDYRNLPINKTNPTTTFTHMTSGLCRIENGKMSWENH